MSLLLYIVLPCHSCISIAIIMNRFQLTNTLESYLLQNFHGLHTSNISVPKQGNSLVVFFVTFIVCSHPLSLLSLQIAGSPTPHPSGTLSSLKIELQFKMIPFFALKICPKSQFSNYSTILDHFQMTTFSSWCITSKVILLYKMIYHKCFSPKSAVSFL